MRRPSVLLALAVAFVSLSASGASADQTFTWSATGHGNWSAGSSWGGTAPTAADGEVDLDFPEPPCVAIITHTECPEVTNDVAGLTIGTMQIASIVDYSNSTTPGDISPGGGSYTINGSEPITLDGGIAVQTTTLGSGDAQMSPGLTDLLVPIVLGADNTWTIGSAISFDLNDSVSGDHALAISGGSDDLLAINQPMEVGPVTLTSVNALMFPSGTDDLNGTDGQSVTLDSSSLGASGTIGPLTVENGSKLTDIGDGPLQVAGGVSFDASSTFDGSMLASGASPQVTATGAADLGGATLTLDDGGCAAAGSVTTLFEAQGGLSGTFSDAAGPITNGQVIQPQHGCDTDASDPIEINYTADSVTATLDPASAPSAPSIPQSTPPPPPPPPSSPLMAIANAKVSSKKHKATFTFTATGDETAAECALVRAHGKHHKFAAPRYVPCSSPEAYKQLAKGKYEFWVEGTGPGGTSPPVSQHFAVN